MNKNVKRSVLVWIMLAIILIGISGFFLYPKLLQKFGLPGFNRPANNSSTSHGSNSAPLSSSIPTPPILQGVTANRLGIGEGTQGQFEDLRIGLGYTRLDDYTDDNGVKQHGNVAGLWIYVRNNSAQNRTLNVYAGQSFTVNKYRIVVDQIVIGHNTLLPGEVGGQGGSVTLLIWEPTPKPTN